MNTATTPFHLNILNELASAMDKGEARATMLLIFDKLMGFTTADVLMGKADELNEYERAKVERAVGRVVDGEPVQYVIGRSDFMDMEIEVTDAVLIPRPETEELVQLCLSNHQKNEHIRILDIGTGSGCIALAIKKNMPKVDVVGWDLSDDALDVARKNAKRLALDVRFEHHDILDIDKELPNQAAEFDIIVSNPPYVCESEAADMERKVLCHEPSLALFVPDNDPLRFYRAIARFALKALKPGGEIYFETNRLYCHDTASLMRSLGFHSVKIIKDQFKNDRIIHCEK